MKERTILTDDKAEVFDTCDILLTRIRLAEAARSHHHKL